jgi:hypothetical protein
MIQFLLQGWILQFLKGIARLEFWKIKNIKNDCERLCAKLEVKHYIVGLRNAVTPKEQRWS